MAKKGCSHFFSCPSCNAKEATNHGCELLESWTIKYPASTASNKIRQVSEIHSLKKPDRRQFPIQYHHRAFKENKDPLVSKKAYLTLSVIDPESDELKIISSELITDVKNGTEEQSEEEKMNIEKMFCILNPILVQASRENFFIAVPSAEKDGFAPTLHDIAICDSTVLHRCIFALATGFPVKKKVEREAEGRDISVRMQSLESTIFACSDMIRHAKDRRRSPLKDFMANQLLVHGAPQALYQKLNRIGISTCNFTVRLDNKNKTRDLFSRGFSFRNKRFNLLMILYDNVGFRRRAGKTGGVGYDQYTALQIVDIPKEKLIDWNIYPSNIRGSGAVGEFSKVA